MTEEVTAEAEVTTAESVDTSTEKSTDAPDAKAEEEPTKTDAAEAESDKPNPKKAEKSYKARAKARREREIASKDQQIAYLEGKLEGQVKSDPESKPPKIEDFESMDEYLDARDSFRDGKKEVKTENKSSQATEYETYVNESRNDLIEAGSDKYEDFAEVVTSEDVKMTDVTRDAIFEMDDQDTQIEVAYFLASNPKEATRITKLSGIRQVKEIGKLEMKLSKATPKRPSTAPKPVSPIAGGKTDTSTINGDEDMKSYIAKRLKQQGRA